jgi:hypothetical protein
MGKGVAVGSGVDVGAGVSVGGTGDGDGVAVGKSGATGVGVAGWQAVMKRRSAMRSFFMALFITQLSSDLCWTIGARLKRYIPN